MVALSKPRAITFVIKVENSVTSIDKTIKKLRSCKKIKEENLILYFVFAYEGIKAWVKAPSAKILLNKFGSLKATKKISE